MQMSFTEMQVNFNSHAHVERDGDKLWDFVAGIISTHTLTWSVTNSAHILVIQLLISTHTLTWSVTDKPQQYLQIVTNFNSHAHVERDNADETKFQEIVNFNSHAHVERDTHFTTLTL
ncbi:Uncharacterised protein [uncultured Ruminococcus sp.]|nr:Uncharacterised protein [uncultured Ruminococcus sp.]